MWGRGTELGGRYTLTERIGGGAMGDVWRADDGVLERRVAVKILLPALLDDARFTARFRREAKILAALSHPGIVDVYDYGESSLDSGARVAYIVMELLDGRPLDEMLTESGSMSAERTLAIVAEALDALQAAHSQDIVHRDIKPSNLMFRADGRVTVTDFGIAAATGTRITSSHSVLGTALYVAPEQAEGAAVPASDLYSLGAVCFEMLTGQVPFTGESALEVVLKHLREPAPALPAAYPQPIRDFVARALAKKPGDRFADAAAMAAAARAAAVGAPTVAIADRPTVAAPVPPPDSITPPEVPAVTEQRPRRMRRGVLIPIIVPCVITLGSGGVWLIDRGTFGTDAGANGAGPTVSVSAPATGGGTGASPALPGGAPSASGTTVTTPPDGQGATNGGNQPGTTPQGGAGGAVGGGSGSGGGGGSKDGGTSAGAGNPPAPPAGSPTPVKSPTSSVPDGCGGSGWGYITNLGDGRRIGLAEDTTARGTGVVMGGYTSYGWVHNRESNGFDYFHACKADSLGMVQPSGGGGIQLGDGYGDNPYWTLQDAGPSGVSYIKDMLGQNCLTDNGAGNRLTVTACTPGNKAQEWRIP